MLNSFSGPVNHLLLFPAIPRRIFMAPLISRKSARAEQSAARRSGRESARVYESLRHQILEGELPAGAHLSQQVIAQSEGTSNGPVISALKRLAFEGLVVHERSHGYRVGEWSETRFDDLLTVRRALETEAARLAARRAGSEDLERLRHIVVRMEQLVAEERWEEIGRAHV